MLCIQSHSRPKCSSVALRRHRESKTLVCFLFSALHRVYDMATGALLLQLSDRAAAALADDGRTFVCANGRDVEVWLDCDGGLEKHLASAL